MHVRIRWMVRPYSKRFTQHMIASIKRSGVMGAYKLSHGSNHDEANCLVTCTTLNKQLCSYDSFCIRCTLCNLHFAACEFGGFSGYQLAFAERRGSAKLCAKHVEPTHCASQDSYNGAPPLVARKSVSHIWLQVYSLFRYARNPWRLVGCVTFLHTEWHSCWLRETNETVCAIFPGNKISEGFLFKGTYCAPDHLVFIFGGRCVNAILTPGTARFGRE